MKVVLLLVASFVAIGLGVPQRVGPLPGYNGPNLSQYSGYIGVGGSRQLFYWFIEAEHNVSTAPLVFWYQGGPGCSGISGLLTEMGPFRVNANGGLDYVNLAWTQFASVVFLEQPAFVGFSYSDDPLDHFCDDSKAARDNLAFVEGFLKEFPQYKNRPTWFSGESYGGVYVPTLAALALSDPSSQVYRQLRGITTGNPVFNCGSSTTANQMQLYYYHGLVSWSDFGPFLQAGCLQQDSETCDSLLEDATNKIGVIYQQLKKKKSLSSSSSRVEPFPNLDPDDLYQDFCTGNGTLFSVTDNPTQCAASGDITTQYLRRKDVHEALHASGPLGLYTEIWSICSSKVIYTPSGRNMVPLYQNFQKQKPGFQVLVYSGDVDIATVPFTTTNPCLAQVSSQITNQWQPWYVNGNTAGYWEQTPLYTHATVKGSGHECPGYAALASFNMYRRFISQGNLTDPSAPSSFARSSIPRGPKRQGQQLREMLRKNGFSL